MVRAKLQPQHCTWSLDSAMASGLKASLPYLFNFMYWLTSTKFWPLRAMRISPINSPPLFKMRGVLQCVDSVSIKSQREYGAARDEDTQQNNSRVLYQNNITTTTIRQYHITNINERSGLAVVMGLGAIAATAKAGQYAVQGYKEWKEARELEEKEMEKLRKENPEMGEENVNKSSDQQQDGKSTDKESSGASGGDKNEQQTNEKRENIFAKVSGT